MTTRPLDPLEERTWRSLWRMTTVLGRAVDEELQRTAGLPLTTYAVLMHLSSAPDGRLRMSELAERTALSPSRMTRVLDALEGDGHAERDRCPGDGRAMLARITPDGRERLSQAWPDHLATVRELLIDLLDRQELEQLASIAERVTAAAVEAGGRG